MQSKLGETSSLRQFFWPRNNHWLRRTILVFAFILFDCLSTIVFCHNPWEEANPYARVFMESFGIPLGLALFVLVTNLPVYMTLSLDSHIIRLPFRSSAIIETTVDVVFAWSVAGLHFSGGVSWFWCAPDLTRQVFGALIYLALALLFVKPHKTCYSN